MPLESRAAHRGRSNRGSGEFGSGGHDLSKRRIDRRADLRNIWDLLALGAGQGTELILEVDGPDATEACDALEAILTAPDMTAETTRTVPQKG